MIYLKIRGMNSVTKLELDLRGKLGMMKKAVMTMRTCGRRMRRRLFRRKGLIRRKR